MKKVCILICISLCISFLSARYSHIGGTMYLQIQDTLPSASKYDSIDIPNSVPSGSIAQKKDMLDAIIDYNAYDSVVLTVDNMGYLHGAAEVTYTNIKLMGEKMKISMDSSLVYATYSLDSIGGEFGFAIFSDGGAESISKSIKYNFKSKKGYVTDIIPTKGDDYVVIAKTKKKDEISFFMLGGKYTSAPAYRGLKTLRNSLPKQQ